MSNPWEAPIFPDRGDDNDADTFRAVGKTISAWETIEFELSRLHSVFERDPDGQSMRKYGVPTIARLRLDGLLEASDRFFVAQPNQDAEGRLHELMIPLRALASRRNEIAHGIVMDITPIEAFVAYIAPDRIGRRNYAAIAPYYQLRQHNKDGLPAYAYTSLNMYLLVLKMGDIWRQIVEFRQRLVALP